MTIWWSKFDTYYSKFFFRSLWNLQKHVFQLSFFLYRVPDCSFRVYPSFLAEMVECLIGNWALGIHQANFSANVRQPIIILIPVIQLLYAYCGEAAVSVYCKIHLEAGASISFNPFLSQSNDNAYSPAAIRHNLALESTVVVDYSCKVHQYPG